MVAPGLEDHAGAGPPVLVGVRRVLAEHRHLAGGADPEALQDLDRGGLARAVRPEQADHLAGADVEVDTGEHVVVAVAHPQVADLDRNLHLSQSSEHLGRRAPGFPGSLGANGWTARRATW